MSEPSAPEIMLSLRLIDGDRLLDITPSHTQFITLAEGRFIADVLAIHRENARCLLLSEKLHTLIAESQAITGIRAD